MSAHSTERNHSKNPQQTVKPVMVRLPAAMGRQLQQVAARESRSMGAQVIHYLRTHPDFQESA